MFCQVQSKVEKTAKSRSHLPFKTDGREAQLKGLEMGRRAPASGVKKRDRKTPSHPVGPQPGDWSPGEN